MFSQCVLSAMIDLLHHQEGNANETPHPRRSDGSEFRRLPSAFCLLAREQRASNTFATPLDPT
jgi:hypothetical protein